MTRVPNNIMDNAIFLYRSAENAKSGQGFGGSGGIVSVESEVESGKKYLYAITNQHVVRGGYPVVRFYTVDGCEVVLELSQDDWIDHPDNDDLVAARLLVDSDMEDQIVAVDNKPLSKVELLRIIGPGDEVFAVGRFIYRGKAEKRKQNREPLLRYGHISSRPDRLVRVYQKARGLDQESFLINLTAHNGFSGSFVYTIIPPFSFRPNVLPLPGGPDGLLWDIGQDEAGKVTVTFDQNRTVPYLIGVYTGHYNAPLHDEGVTEDESKVYEHSGISYVIPAFKINEILNDGTLKAEREQEESRLVDQRIPPEETATED